jgi:hypothetical protein
MKCSGCGTVENHGPGAKKCDICGDELIFVEKIRIPKK